MTLGDGTKAKFAIDFLDDRCNAEEGISVVRRIASSDAFIAVGPTCSNVAESLFGILQKKVGDASDSGLQFPIIADVAAKGGLAKISEWAFRNVPSEFEMYKSLMAWVKTTHPELKSIYGGVEKDFAHSNATYGVMKAQAEANGFTVAGTAEWLLNDTTFSTQVRNRLDTYFHHGMPPLSGEPLLSRDPRTTSASPCRMGPMMSGSSRGSY